MVRLVRKGRFPTTLPSFPKTHFPPIPPPPAPSPAPQKNPPMSSKQTITMHSKTTSPQTYQLLLYRKALHPELFPPKSRRLIKHGAYEAEAWVLPGGHVVRFRFGSFSACELVVDQEGGLPVEGAVTALPCAGEHEFEHDFVPEKVKYLTTLQTETLPENLYQTTYDEMVDFAGETNALIHKWADRDAGPVGGKNLSVVDVQRLSKEIHAQSYHLIASTGLVLRTQTIFEHR